MTVSDSLRGSLVGVNFLDLKLTIRDDKTPPFTTNPPTLSAIYGTTPVTPEPAKVPYSQLLCTKRICSDEKELQHAQEEMREFF